jgi:apurinic endonuclease APN1
MWSNKITNLGSHISFGGSLQNMLENANVSKANSVQFFMGAPLQVKRSNISSEDIDYFNTHSKIQNVFTHLPYLFNLAGSVKHSANAWSGTPQVDHIVNSYIKGIQQELDTLHLLKVPRKGSVLHIGSSAISTSSGLESVAKSINKLNLYPDTPLILETMVGRGGVLGKSYNELASVLKMISHPECVKICIDTCHVYAEGNYDLTQQSECEKMVDDFSSIFGSLDKLALFHLNDSKAGFNSHKDLHEYISKGEIWSSDLSTFRWLIDWSLSHSVPLVLETDSTDIKNVNNLLF